MIRAHVVSSPSERVRALGRFRKAIRGILPSTLVAALFLAGHSVGAQTPTTFPGSTATGHLSIPISVTIPISGNGVAVTPKAVSQGLAGADFTLAAGGTCSAGVVYSAGQSCTVFVAFQPKSPGLRTGAVLLTAVDGSLLGSALVAATGSGSLAVFEPGEIDTVVGNNFWLYRGDNVLGTDAPIFLPTAVVADAGGNIFISDFGNFRIRRVDALTGLISTVAGDGIPGFAGDGGPAVNASIGNPSGLIVDGAGNIYFADTNNNAIRRVDAVTHLITTVAGTGTQGYTGDGNLATAATLYLPEGIAFDPAGNLYIADTGNNVIRMVDAITHKIRTVAGTGAAGYNGDNIAATSAQLNSPWNLGTAVDGSILIADISNNRVRKFTAGGNITTIAGTGGEGFTGDGGIATGAQLHSPVAIATDPAGNIYIADSGNNRVRKINASTGFIDTIVGDGGETFGGDLGLANQAGLYGPYALFFDNVTGNLLVADMFHNRIRRVSATALTLQFAAIRVTKASPPFPVGVQNDGNATLTFAPPTLLNAALEPSTTTCAPGPLVTATGCKLGVQFAPTVVGSLIQGSVTLNSDATNQPSIISISGPALSVEPTITTLTSSLNPTLVGASFTFTAIVKSADTSRTGPITFLDGATAICSNVQIDATGTALCATTTLTLGQHSITAAYAGDPNNAASTSNTLLQFVQQPVTLVLGATPTTAIATSPVLLAVTATTPTGTPSGTVTFYDGTTAIGTSTLVAGAVSISTTQLSPGVHSLTAQTAASGNNAASTSNVVTETITEGTTLTTLASSASNVKFGTAVTFTATVISTNGPTPTGNVQFKEGNTVLGTGTISASGIATLTLSSVAPGSHNIVAAYLGDANDSVSNSVPLIEVIQQIPTTTTLTSNAASANAGAAIQLTAKVGVAAGATANGVITGQVTFSSGSTLLGSAPVNASGIATLSVNSLPVGTDGIMAVYAGDSNYLTSTSSALIETISVAALGLTLSGPASVDVATASTFSVLLNVTGPAPTGAITLRDGNNTLSAQAATANGTYTFTTASLSLGTHTLIASYGGDSNYATTASNSITVVVHQAAAAITLQTSANPQIVGQSVTFTATVTSASPNITGTITLSDGLTSLTSTPVNASGVATFTLSTLVFGTHNLSASYAGDANHVSATSLVLAQRIVQPATVAIGSSVNPATAGAPVVFTAKLTGAAGLTPTGTVTFLDGSTVLGTGTLDATATTTFSTSALFVGTHSITASYAGDPSFSASTSTPLIETVQSASTQIAISTSANPAIYATPLTLTATITTSGSLATGSVTFTDGGTAIGTTLLNGSGVATLTLSTLTPGSHSIIANYAGDSNTAASISTPYALSVKQVTSTALSSSANPALTLASVTLTAMVNNSGVGTATGNVTFMDGTTLLGTVALDAQGHASITVPQFAAGNHPVTATYTGDAQNFSGVSAALTQGVTLRSTQTALTAVTTSTTNTQQVTLISVVRWSGPAVPTGTITFTSAGLTLGTATIDATGVATMTIVVSSTTETVVANYSGDASYAASSSIATAITGGPATQFTMQIAPPTMTLQSKQHGVVNITITSVKDYTDTMDFGCLGLPFAATCTFSSAQMKLEANGTHTVQLTIDTGNPLGSGGAIVSNAHASSNGVLLAFIPGSLLAGFLLFRRKRRLPMLSLIALFLGLGALLSATGCNGLQINGTPAGTYTFKVAVTGAGTGVSQTQDMTLTVTQ